MYNFKFLEYFELEKVDNDNDILTFKSDLYHLTLKIKNDDEYFTVIVVRGITVLSLTVEKEWTLAFIDDIIRSMILEFCYKMVEGGK